MRHQVSSHYGKCSNCGEELVMHQVVIKFRMKQAAKKNIMICQDCINGMYNLLSPDYRPNRPFHPDPNILRSETHRHGTNRTD